MGNLSIRNKLMLLFGCAMLALLVLGAVSIHETAGLNAQFVSASGKQQKLLAAVDEARGAQVHFKIQVQEWKNILLRGKDPAAFDKYQRGFTKEGQQVMTLLASVKQQAIELGMAERLKVDEVIAAFTPLAPAYLDALKSYDRNQADPAAVVDQLVKGIDRNPSQRIDGLVAELQKAAQEISAAEEALAASRYNATRIGLALVLLVSGVILAAFSWQIIRSITGPVAALQSSMRQIATTNDLTVRANIEQQDEIGAMAQAFNAMVAKMQQLVGQVSGSVKSVNLAANEMANSAGILHATASEQSQSVVTNAASIEQLTVSIATVADTAELVRGQSSQSLVTTNEGNQRVAELVAEIRRIEATVADIASAVENFVSSTSTITSMTREVREIADQTNLLALNAAIEAARAGEQGRGFAVVADEVRKLAEKSSGSASEIDAVAKSIMQQTAQVKDAIDAGRQSIELSSGLAGEVELTLNQARSAVENASRGVDEITWSVKEQKAASTELAQQMERISTSAENTSSTALQMSSSAGQLRDAADQLAQAIAGFRVNPAV